MSIVHGSESQFRYENRTVPRLSPSSHVRHIRDQLLRPTEVSWFDLDSRVEVINAPRMSASSVPDGSAVVATSCWSAPFVASLPESRGKKSYFIQHYETWSAEASFVDGTWRLPLTKIVIAKWLRDQGVQLGVETEYVPNAIDSHEFTPGPPISARPLLVSALVSDLAWKRTDLLIEALTLVKLDFPELRAVTFGTCSRPEAMPEWVEFLRSPTKTQLVHEIYQQSRIYVCSSDAEGWHLPPAEAMACGAAVASTDIDGVKEYAENIALFSPIGDAQSLAGNVMRLLGNQVECDERAIDGLRMIANYQTSDATSRLLDALFK